MSIVDRPAVQRYLDQVCSRIANERDKKQIRLEISGHIEDSVQTRLDAGVPEPEAIELALLRLGDPSALGKRLEESHRPFYRRFRRMAALTASLCGIIWLAYVAKSTHDLFHQVDHLGKNTESWLEPFLKDQDLLAHESFFAPPGRNKDAGEYLNGKVEWEFYPESHLTRFEFKKWPEITIPTEARGQLGGSWRSDWLYHRDEVDTSSINLNWMSTLEQYDHWDLFAHGPLKEVVGHGVAFNPFAIPLPNYDALLVLAKLRLLQGIQQRQLAPALKEVRQLARLVFSQEMPVALLSALSITEAEREAYELGIHLKLKGLQRWHPLSPQIVTIARRSLYAYSGIFSAFVPRSVLEKVFLGSGAPIGKCSALAHGMIEAAILRPYLNGSMPFERDFLPQFTLLDRIVAEAPKECRINYARWVWKDPTSLRWSLFVVGNTSLTSRMKYIFGAPVPYLRQAVGAELSATLLSDFGSRRYASLER